MTEDVMHSSLAGVADEIGALVRRSASLMGEVSAIAFDATMLQSRVIQMMKDHAESAPTIAETITTFMGSDEFLDFCERNFPIAISRENSGDELSLGHPPQGHDDSGAGTADWVAASSVGGGEGSVEEAPGGGLDSFLCAETDQVVTDVVSGEQAQACKDPEAAPAATEPKPERSKKDRALDLFAATGAGAVQIAEEVGSTYNSIKDVLYQARRVGDPRAAQGDLKRLDTPEFKNAPNSVEPEYDDIGRAICSVSYVDACVEVGTRSAPLKGLSLRLVDRLKTQTRISVDEATEIGRCREFGLRRELDRLQQTLVEVGLTIHENEEGFQLRFLAVEAA